MSSIKKFSVLLVMLCTAFAALEIMAQPQQGGQRAPQLPIEEQAEIYRNAVFEAINYQYGVLNGMSRGQIEEDDARFAKAANDMNALAGMVMEGFVIGSPEYPGLTTDAVWEDSEEFFELVVDFQEKAAALAAVADQGVSATQDEVNTLRQTCGGCHRNYRERVQ